MSSSQQQDCGIQVRQTQQAPPGNFNPSNPFDHYDIDISQQDALGSPAHVQSPTETETPRTHSHSHWPMNIRQSGYDTLGLSSPAFSGPSAVKSCPGVNSPATGNIRPLSSNHAFPITASNAAYGLSAAVPSVPATCPASSSYPATTTTDDKSFHAFWETVLGTSNESRSDNTTAIPRSPKPQSPSPSCYTSQGESIASTPQTKSTHLPQKRSTARDHSKRLEAALRDLQGRERRKQKAKNRRRTVKESQDMLQTMIYSEEENARFAQAQPPSQKQIMWDAVARWPIMQRLNQKAVDMDEQAKAISEQLAFALELLSRSRREADALRAEVEQKRLRLLDRMNAQAKQMLAGLCPQVSHLRQDVKTNLENIANAKAGKY